MIKKYLLILIVLFQTVNLCAQVMWINDLPAAQKIAKETNKLILMDFWAVWCGPCNKMDKDLWNSKEMSGLAKHFIGVRIDVDYNKTVAVNYNVQSIPKVILATYSGETLLEKVGYMNADLYLSILNSLPEDLSGLYQSMQMIDENLKDSKANMKVGFEFQQAGRKLKNNELMTAFLLASEKFYSKARKYSTEPSLTEEIELRSILNDVYFGKAQKAIKQIDKLKPQSDNSDLAELRHFVLAKCYKTMSESENFQKEKSQIINSDLIAELDN